MSELKRNKRVWRLPEWAPWSFALFTVLLAVFSYWPSLSGDFYLDDYQNIVDVAALQVEELSLEHLSSALRGAHLPSRPVANLTFVMDYRIAGLDPVQFRITNLLIHLSAGAAIALLAFQYLVLTGDGRRDRAWLSFVAVLSASMFLLHPLAIQAVSYIVQRMASLATLFCTMALAAYLWARTGRGRRSWGWVLFVIAWTLALGSKETAASLFLVLVALELTVLRARWPEPIKRLLRRDHAVVIGWSLALVAGLLFVIWAFQTDRFEWSELLQGRTFTGRERVLTQSRVFFLYLGLLVWPAPSRLSLFHQIQPSSGIFDPPSTLLSIVGVLLVVVLSVWLSVRRPRYGFPVLMFLLLQAMEAGPLNLELVFEHRMYFPMVGLALLVSGILADSHRRARAAIGLAMVTILILSIATSQRNRFWGDELSFYQSAVEGSAESARAWHGLGVALRENGESDEARFAFERALHLDPDLAATRAALGSILLSQGERARAVSYLEGAVRRDPTLFGAALELAGIHTDHGETARAIELYRHVMTLSEAGSRERDLAEQRLQASGATPMSPDEALFRRGVVLMSSRRYDEAADSFRRVLEMSPENPAVLSNLGISLVRSGNAEQAIEVLGTLLRLHPENTDALYGLSLAYEELGRKEEAIETWERFLAEAPVDSVWRERARVHLSALTRE